MDAIELDNTHRLRCSVLAGVCGLLGAIGCFLGIINLFISGKWPVLAYLQFLYSLFSFYLLWRVYNNKHKVWQTHLYVSSLTALVIYAVYISAINSFIFCWALVLPTVYYLILGKKYASIPIFIMFIMVTIDLINKYGLALSPVLVNFICSYLIIWIVSHTYEKNRAHSEAELQKLALKDPLTQSFNRLALTRKFALADTQSMNKNDKNMHMLILDIDHFKHINDNYGHEAGDHILQRCANLLSSIAGDNNIFRIGGEEFCVLVESASNKEAIALAESIRAQIASAIFVVQDKSIDIEVGITVSIGISHYRQGMDLSHLLREADLCLYQAKGNGRDQVVYPLLSLPVSA
ncbi:GGDEF domain-containing protein [Shewanella sp. 0m-4]